MTRQRSGLEAVPLTLVMSAVDLGKQTKEELTRCEESRGSILKGFEGHNLVYLLKISVKRFARQGSSKPDCHSHREF